MKPVPLAAGLDVGGTKIHAVALDPEGTVVTEIHRPTEGSGSGPVTASIAGAVGELAGAAGISPEEFAVLGVGIPGMVDMATGTVRHAVNLGIGAEGVPLAAALAESFGVAVAVENDANAATVGAATLLATDDLAYLSIGTGIAAGAVLRGRLRRGSHGAAGEIGHLSVDPTGPVCPCGQRGCLETLASGAAIARRWPTDGGLPPAAALFTAARAGDPDAIRLRDEIAGHLATAVAAVALLLDPAVVALGGGAVEVGDPLLDAIRAALAARGSSAPALADLGIGRRLVVVPPRLGAGALGAARLAVERWAPAGWATMPA